MTYPDKEALGVAGILGSLPPSSTAVAQLSAEHWTQPPLGSVCISGAQHIIDMPQNPDANKQLALTHRAQRGVMYVKH